MAMDIRKKYMGMEMAPTGDPLIDMWERQIAAGEVPDLDACEDAQARARDAKLRKAAFEHFKETGERFYTPPTPSFVEQIEKMREESDLPDFDVSDYHEEVNRNPFERPASRSMSQYDLEDSLQDMSPAAFDQFVNAAGLLKK